jgi:putative N6-adenine-specific DNA methylase
MEEQIYIAKTFKGLEEVLAEEIKNLGGTEVEIIRRAVRFKATTKIMYRCIYELRTALNILYPIHSFTFETEREYYNKLYAVDWWKYFDVEQNILLDAGAFNSIFNNSHFVALRAKDAIADKFRYFCNRRPNVARENPDIKIDIYINGNECNVSLIANGMPLFKRGYRQKAGRAPINEVLAAGMLQISGWKGDTDFIDPMCGSGTFLIEAYMLANNVPAQYYRDDFTYNFLNWTKSNLRLWKEVKEEANSKITNSNIRIIGNDLGRQTFYTCENNLKHAKLARKIDIYNQDVREFQPKIEGPALVMVNPPYGERIRPKDMDELYKGIGDTLKQHYEGCDAWIISGDLKALKRVGLATKKRHILFNGPMECRFNHYELYKGSRKNEQQEN